MVSTRKFISKIKTTEELLAVLGLFNIFPFNLLLLQVLSLLCPLIPLQFLVPS